MAASARHLWEQRRGLSALGRFLMRKPPLTAPEVPGAQLLLTTAPPSDALISDFVRFTGGDPGWYRASVPPHLFSFWSLPCMLQVASTLPYPPLKVINVGCSLRIHGALPRRQPLRLKGQLLALEEQERYVSIEIGVDTQIEGEPAAIEGRLRVRVSKSSPSGSTRPRKAHNKLRESVPLNARLLSVHRLTEHAGLDFAKLTGDFNPIHWLKPVARQMGFRSVILHGFGSFALAFDAIAGGYLGGEPEQIAYLDARFEQPLLLPAKVGVYLQGDTYYVGDAPGGRAYVVGRVELKD